MTGNRVEDICLGCPKPEVDPKARIEAIKEEMRLGQRDYKERDMQELVALKAKTR